MGDEVPSQTKRKSPSTNEHEPKRARTTPRENAGVPPARYGLANTSSTPHSSSLLPAPSLSNSNNTLPEGSQQQQRSTTKSVSSCNTKSSKSTRTSKSTSSTITRQLEIDHVTQDEIDRLEENFELREREIEQEEFSVKTTLDTIGQLKDELQKPDLSKEAVMLLKIKLSGQENLLVAKQRHIEEDRIKMKFEQKSLQRKLDRLRRQAEIDKRVAEEEDENEDSNSQHLSDSDDEVFMEHPDLLADKDAVIDRLTDIQKAHIEARTRLERALVAEKTIAQQQSSAAEIERAECNEYEDSLLKRLRRLKDGMADPVVNEVQQPAKVVSTNEVSSLNPCSSPSSDISTQLAQVLSQAFEKLGGMNTTNNTEKFLARQVQGKDLPIFTGRPEEWSIFITAYENSTLGCSYTNMDNLPRLQKAIKGEALKTIQCLLARAENVPSIIKKLRMRFGRPEHIIQMLINKTKEVPSFKEDRLDLLIEFGLSVDNLVETIRSLNCPEHLTSPQLLDEFSRKLPVALRTKWMEWITSNSQRKENLESFAEWLTIQTEIACRICPPKPKDDPPVKKQWDERKPRRREEKVWAVAEQEKSNKPNSRKHDCFFCDGNGHMIAKCRRFEKENIDSRWDFVKSKRLCFCCLNPGHCSRDCTDLKNCDKKGCQRTHHPILHKELKQQRAPPPPIETAKETMGHATGNRPSTTTARDQVNLMILPVVLKGPKGTKHTFAMLDPGATVTVIDDEVADELGLQGIQKPFIHRGLHPTMEEMDSRCVSLEILSSNNQNFALQNVRTKSHLYLPNQSVQRKMLSKWKHLQNLPIKCYDQGRPTILIGMDNYRLSVTKELRLGPGNAPAAGRTELGWVLLGNVTEVNPDYFCGMIFEKPEDALHQLVKQHFTTENFGVKLTTTTPRSKEDIYAQTIMDNTIKRIGDCWESGLLWKSEDAELPSSKQMAMSRLLQMERRMDRDPEFAQQYLAKIDEYLGKGFARVLSKQEAKIEGPRTFYLPHFMNRNPKKPKKLRFVFDAAAKLQGVSLNDKLLKGPDKLTSLPTVLLQFRQKVIGITADIKDMFHRVKIRKDDASAQRFLWRGMDRNCEPDVLEMGVLIFGAACSPACAQEVKNLNAKGFEDEFPEGSLAIIKSHYVDDYLDSVDSVEKAVEMFQQVRHIHQQGGFNICNWISNSREVLSQIPSELHAPGVKNMDFEGEAERVLGLFWKPDSDNFTFSMTFLKASAEVIESDRLPTKRELLALVMSIYDPLGFASILTIKAKIIMQDTWRLGIGWDDQLPGALKDKWERWLEELKTIDTFQLPRCLSPEFMSAEEIQLHVFCDASEQAFGAVGYFRIVTDNSITVSLVMSKAKVSPTKHLTIPRLELQAALLGTRLGSFIKSGHDVSITKIVYWSDSSTVLKWIRSEGNQYKQFVACRVGEILESSDVTDWRWIPTKLNVADELTRDAKPCDWSSSSRWVNGPDFMKTMEDDWPKEIVRKPINPDEDTEMKKEFVCFANEVKSILDINRFSSYSRAIRSAGYVLRAVKNFRFPNQKPDQLELSPVEVGDGEKWWWRWSQQESFGPELESIRNKRPLIRRLLDVDAVLDEDGILRIQGRIDNAHVPVCTKRPVVLHSKNRFTQLLILYYHQKNGHHGQEMVVNELRQKYHIFQIRSAVRKAWKDCQKCKISKAQPVIPQMGQLPEIRLESFVSPFKNAGLDYFGPLSITVGRRHEKRWVALFTCLSTRAVHLEMTSTLSTDGCIMAIRRFIARRGSPCHIYSDNGTNFVGAHNELRKALKELDQHQLTADCTTNGISWHFIPPHAPHMGGSWERMVRSVKVALTAILKERHPKEEILQTLLVEAEHIVNGHPLTHVPVDPDDLEALTPNHWLIGRSSKDQVPGLFVEGDLCLRKQWRQAQQLINHFWKRWVREYLPVLLRRTKWNQQTDPIKIGDLVIVINNQLPRNSWPRGIVVKLFPGKDGIVRVVDVRSAAGISYRRPVANLCRLDVQKPATTDDDVPENSAFDGSEELVSTLTQQ